MVDAGFESKLFGLTQLWDQMERNGQQRKSRCRHGEAIFYNSETGAAGDQAPDPASWIQARVLCSAEAQTSLFTTPSGSLSELPSPTSLIALSFSVHPPGEQTSPESASSQLLTSPKSHIVPT